MNPIERRQQNVLVFLQVTAATKDFLTAAEIVRGEATQLSLASLGPIWLHAHAMCDTLRPREDGQIMWNLPALASSARTMLECFIGLAHLTQAKTASEEELRALLWHRQTEFKVADILRGGAKSDPQSGEIAARLMERVAEIEKKIKQCAAFSELDGQTRHRILNSREQYLTSPPIDVWEREGLRRDAYHYSWRALSQWAHVTPLALFLQAGFVDDQKSLVTYTNDALDVAFTSLTRVLTLTVRRTPELNPASGRVAAIIPQFAFM